MELPSFTYDFKNFNQIYYDVIYIDNERKISTLSNDGNDFSEISKEIESIEK